MSKNPLLQTHEYGQSIWLDFIRRKMLDNRELERLITDDGLRGVTVNPSILDKAISGSNDYELDIERMSRQGKKPAEIYESLAIRDVQRAADLFRPLYKESEGRHGFVSLEISPYLAYETEKSIREAKRFWNELDRPNVMIKVPGTQPGLTAIRRLTAEGINVNVTLLFGLPRYRQVVQAYLDGLRDRLEAGKPIDHLASVASFFLSRIDVLVDPKLEAIMDEGTPRADTARRIHGQAAIASARLAYQIYKEIFEGPDFQELADQGARVQRLLWASTSTKNPHYSDVKYVDALIGPQTVNTIPRETLDAYRDHGDPASRLEQGLEEARQVMQSLEKLDIDIDQVTQQLEQEGVEKFERSYDDILDTLEEERASVLLGRPDRQWTFLGAYERDVDQRLSEWEQFAQRLWDKDPSVWKDDPQHQEIIRNGLGWLDVVQKMEKELSDLRDFAAQARRDGFTHVVHIGMGGSSLAPMVFARTFSPSEDGLPLRVLDTTNPESILNVERELPLETTLFIIASKSGTTAETRALADYYYHWAADHKNGPIGENFVAITDPGSPLEKLAGERDFRRTFLNFPDIGGRYSALSYFGLVPAALMGLDLDELLRRAQRMIHACDPKTPARENPGLSLGACLGELALNGRDKLTLLTPNSMATFGLWLEQLLAESTGKEGKGIIPVAGEPLGVPLEYEDDRVFVYFRLKNEENAVYNELVEGLEDAGHPVITILMDDHLDLGQEFFRWEFATATAGAILGIDAFNQPNVQESKDNTNRLLSRVAEDGRLDEVEPTLTQNGVSVFSETAAAMLLEALDTFFVQAQPGDYVALMAYLTETPQTNQILQEIRTTLRNSLHLVTTLGYGPRFLHSTGQLHKGGPNTGLYLQITAEDRRKPMVPGKGYSFSEFKLAQALGDFNALRQHERRVMRIHLGKDVPEGLAALQKAINESLALEYQEG
jgi:transaldolase/glucose-6-phosphate isomerase